MLWKATVLLFSVLSAEIRAGMDRISSYFDVFSEPVCVTFREANIIGLLFV